MTTSDSSSSDKKVYVECISSEVYLTVIPERKNTIEQLQLAEKYNKEVYRDGLVFKYSCGTAYGMHSAFGGQTKVKLEEKYGREGSTIYIPAYLSIKISYEEVLDLLNRANAMILETDEGIRSAINKIIDTDTKGGIQSGTLRFFSNDLICYYTGKNWKKIERRP